MNRGEGLPREFEIKWEATEGKSLSLRDNRGEEAGGKIFTIS